MTTSTSIDIKDLKDVAATLRRFADVRETAKEPFDRVLVQVAKGRLKFVAGDENTSVVADAAPAEGKVRVVVNSRLLLSSVDTLKGRGSIGAEVSGTALILRNENGGRVVLNAIASTIPDFVRPVKKAEAEATVVHPGMSTAAKVFPSVTSKHFPANLVYLQGSADNLTLTGCDERSYAQWNLVDTDLTVQPRVRFGALPAALFRQVVDLKDPGVIAWGLGRLAIRSGRFLVGARLVGESMPWPLPDYSDDTRVVVDRKGLMDALKGSMDGMKRSRLSVKNGSLLIEAWDGAGSVELPATVEGRGHVGVDADRTKKLLMALPGKQVTIEFGGGTARPIRLSTEEAAGWLTILAPVV